MEARILSGASGKPSQCSGFSRKPLTSPSTWSMTPNEVDSSIGWRMPAIVQGLPDAMCESSICEKSMRKMLSAPTITR